METEKRLIDANKIPYHKSGFPKGDGFDSGLDWAFRGDIEKLPTVDAVEVVHGKWEILDDGYGCELMCCSVCKSEFYDGDNDTVDHPHNYCPNCGAKMDGDGNGS